MWQQLYCGLPGNIFFTFSEHETTEWANCGYRTLILFLHCGRNCQILFQNCHIVFGFWSMMHNLIGKLSSFWVGNGKKRHGCNCSDAIKKQFHEFSHGISKSSSRICHFIQRPPDSWQKLHKGQICPCSCSHYPKYSACHFQLTFCYIRKQIIELPFDILWI